MNNTQQALYLMFVKQGTLLDSNLLYEWTHARCVTYVTAVVRQYVPSRMLRLTIADRRFVGASRTESGLVLT